MKVPFFSPERQYNKHKKEFQQIVENVFKGGSLINGTFVNTFEKELANYCNAKYSVGMSSGTNAITTALKCLKIGPGDEVITTSYSAIPTASAISQTGATPIFIDVNPNGLIDPSLIEATITKNTKAIIPVHLYGQLCDMKTISAIAKKHGLFIIEDCAQALGTSLAGSYSDIAAYSFYPTKNLGAFGDAGAITTNNKKYASWCRSYSNYGVTNGLSEFHGINNRMDDLQAAFLSFKLTTLTTELAIRKNIAETYTEGLKNISDTQLPPLNSSHHLFVIQTSNRNKLVDFLNSKQITTLIHYKYILPELPQYNNKNTFPTATALKNNSLSLPLFPELRKEEIEYVIKCVISFYQ